MEKQLTFGEQVKIILGRKGMTIKDLAEQVEAYTGKNMSRQNMTQRLGRDNFQEQDMRLIAEILGCKFQLSIMESLSEEEEQPIEMPEKKTGFRGVKANLGGKKQEEKKVIEGEINPYTGREYASNSVRMHPNRIGYVQVYDREDHKWTDMTEWAFLGFQERKKKLLGKEYKPPTYLD